MSNTSGSVSVFMVRINRVNVAMSLAMDRLVVVGAR
jgi:hypothetical protein